MFGFLTPAALFGLGLIGIPVLVHLFRPRKVRQTPFSSLRWLRPTRHRFSRRVQWHRLLLMAMRVAFLALLILTLAKPVYSRRGNPAGTERFIIVDVSRSMNYAQADGSRPIDTARRVVEQMLTTPVARQRTTVVLAGSEARGVGPLVGDPRPYVPQLLATSAGVADADLSSALPLIGSMLDARRRGSAVELTFVTDHHVSSWSAAAISRFVKQTEAPLGVSVIDVGPAEAQNAWVADARLIESEDTQGRAVRVRVGAVGHRTQQRLVRVAGLNGMPAVSKSVRFEGRDHASVEFDIPPQVKLNGQVAKIQIEPADALPDDDIYWLNLDASSSIGVLLLEARVNRIEQLQPAFHLGNAIDALASSAPRSVRLTRRLPTDVLGPEIAAADVVIMADVPALADSDLRSLERHVLDGGSLVIFLGPMVDLGFYNTAMHDPERTSRCLLPMRVGDRIVASKDAAPARLARVDRTHPLFEKLIDPIYGDLAQTQFSAYRRLDPVVTGGRAQVLATIGDSVPAVVESPFGAGWVVVFNTTANDAWSDLARRKSFVPMVDHLLQYLAGGNRDNMFALDDRFTVAIPGGDRDVAVSVLTPGGRTIRPTARVRRGRNVIQLDGQREAGVYHVEVTAPSGATRFPFVVQPDGRDSVLARADQEQVESWWAPVPVRVLRPAPKTATLELPETGFSMEPWLIAFASVVFLVEMYLVHRLCPVAHSAVV